MTFAQITAEVQFTSGTWTDISQWVNGFTISRPSTIQQGPLVSWQAGTCSLALDNVDGRFDPDNLAGPYTATSALQVIQKTFSAGSGNWTAPLNLSGGTIRSQNWAAGGGAGAVGFVIIGGSKAPNPGGGSGEYAEEPALAVTPGSSYAWSVGGATLGDGANTTFIGDSVTVTAHGGKQPLAAGGVAGGAKGTGSTNSIHDDGAAGGAGGSGTGTGGGGASSGAPGSAGNPGSSGGAGGAAVPGGGPGAKGTTGTGSKPSSGPGGGGSGSGSGSLVDGGKSAAGKITITYAVTVPSATVTQLIPMVPVRVRAVFAAVTYMLFTGYADGWLDPAADAGPLYDQMTLPASDAFKVLAGIILPVTSPLGSGDDSGDRVNRILDAAGWDPSARLVDQGDSLVQPTVLGTSALSELQLTADTEIGSLYADGSGNVVFRHRQALLEDARSQTPQAVFGDLPGTVQAAGTELAYASAGRARDDTTLANDVQVTRAGGTLQEAQDLTSESQFRFTRSYANSSVILTSDAEAMSWALWVLYVSKDATGRFDQIAVDPLADQAGLYPQVLGRDIGDRIQIWKRPPNVPSPVTKDCFIRGITHSYDSATQAWLTTWDLQPADKYGAWLTLDAPVAGKLDSNALAY